MRILFAAMADSIHTARWINQISQQDWDIHVFDFNEGGVNVELSNVTTHTVYPPPKQQSKLKAWESDFPFRLRYLVRRNLPSLLERHLFPSRIEAFVKLVKELKPDILHSLEMQHESYPLLEAKNILDERFRMPWIYSVWGSDIYYFSKQPKHLEQIRAVLAQTDYCLADCYRDIKLAKEYGFKGEVLGVYPTGGGYHINELRQSIEIEQPSKRRTIAVKGYHHCTGRALVALKSLQLCADLLENYTLEIYLASEVVKKAAAEFTASTGIPIKITGQAKNVEILKLFGRSRISIGMSISDGSPNTLLEAMIMGAFPIQSDTVSTAEWITDGENGFLVPPEDAEYTAQAIRQALTDNELVDRAATLNKELTFERVDYSIVQPQVVDLYEKVYQQDFRQSENHEFNKHSL